MTSNLNEIYGSYSLVLIPTEQSYIFYHIHVTIFSQERLRLLSVFDAHQNENAENGEFQYEASYDSTGELQLKSRLN